MLKQIQQSQQNSEEAAKAYAKAQDELKQTETKAYADGIVTKEEQRAINDAIAKRDEAKRYAEQKHKRRKWQQIKTLKKLSNRSQHELRQQKVMSKY